MRLNSLSTAEFAHALATDSAKPGGGAAAAYMGAQGAALVAMVAGLSLGREKYVQYEELAGAARDEAIQIKNELLLLMDRDVNAYSSLTAVFSMKKSTQAEQDERRQALQTALAACTLTPYETMVYASRGIGLAHSLMGKSNSNAAGDLGVASLALKAALEGAWLNVLINTNSLEDKKLALQYQQEGEALRSSVLPLVDEITGWVYHHFKL